MGFVTTIDQLEALYGRPPDAAVVKESRKLTPHYRDLIAASPFYCLATAGPDGLDCSPRGDRYDGIRIADDTTLMLPDRRGNNRVDSLRNIVRDPRVGLLFLIPGSGTTLRLNGTARVSIDPTLLASFSVEEKSPRSILIITVDTVFFQCARAIHRADLWNPAHHGAADDLPTPGEILAAMSDNRIGGATYDREWPQRAEKSMW